MSSIIRVKKESHYVVLNKTALNDDRLSWKAKGLHAYMLSKPDDWVFHDTELQKHAKDGRDALKTAIKELKDLGYMKRIRHRGESGKFIYETVVYEIPQLDLPSTEKPYTDNPVPEKPLTENPKLLSNDVLNNDLLSNDLRTTTTENPVRFYESNLGMLSPLQMQEIWDWNNDYNGQSEILIEAMKIALDRNKKNMGFVKYLLKNWQDRGAKTLADVQALETEWNGKGGVKGATAKKSVNVSGLEGYNFDW